MPPKRTTGSTPIAPLETIPAIARDITHGNIPEVSASELTTVHGIQEEVTRLKSQLATLLQENERLHQQIKTQPTTPEDFASALQQSLDKLQTMLFATTNPVSNFAVREFKLETNVELAISQLGTVSYRLPSAAEKIDAARLSKISIQLVPIPKQNVENAALLNGISRERALAELDGFTPQQLQTLHANGIYTAADFLSVATRARSSFELTNMLKLERSALSPLFARVQLQTIQLIDPPRATILLAAGIDSLSRLSELSPEDLVKTFASTMTKFPNANARPITLEEAERIIVTARAQLASA